MEVTNHEIFLRKSSATGRHLHHIQSSISQKLHSRSGRDSAGGRQRPPLTGYNLETGIRTIVPADIREEGTLVLGARLFGEIVRKLPDDIVTFQSENYMVNIKCGMSEFNILGTDPEEFPELPP